MHTPKNIFIPSAALILTDYLPAGEGLIAYNLLDFIGRSGNNLTVMSPQIKLNSEIYNAQIYEVGGHTFFPAPAEFNYLLRWRKYARAVERLYKNEFKNYEFDIVHYMMPVNINQSYSPVLKKPFIVGPIFHPWINLTPEEYSINEIRAVRDFPGIGRIKNYIKRYLRKVNEIRFNDTLAAADKIVVTLNCVKQFINEKFHNKIVKIPIGVDTYYFTPAKELPDNNTILFLAYMVRRKGLEYLIEAIDIIKKRIPDVKLIVVGDGPDKKFFVDLTRELGLTENIEFKSAAAHRDTIHHFRQAQIYALPSLCEPFGMSALEAMACGLPVVGVNAGGLPEVMGEANKNMLAPPRDSAALAEIILSLMFDYERCKRIGAENREYVVRNYDWRIIASQYNNIYDEICG